MFRCWPSTLVETKRMKVDVHGVQELLGRFIVLSSYATLLNSLFLAIAFTLVFLEIPPIHGTKSHQNFGLILRVPFFVIFLAAMDVQLTLKE